MLKKAQLSDILNFTSKLSLPKIWNFGLLLASYQFSKIYKKSIHKGSPMTISIEPTTACNLRCPECPSGLRSFTRETGNLKSDFFKNTIDQLHDKLMYLILYFQGEPYINPQFLEMVAYAKSKNLYTITSTNGHFLNEANAKKTVESGLDRIIISIDGITQETYEAYRKEGNLQNVIQGAQNLIKWKKELQSSTPYIIFQFLVVKPNEHEIEGLFKLAKEVGVDEVKLKTAQVYDFKNGNELIPTLEKYSRYKKNVDGTYSIKNYLLNHCWKMWNSCVITWDGIVVPCCFDKDADHRLGNLKSDTFADVWKSKEYDIFRNLIIQGRDKIDICNNCTEGCKVWESVNV